MKRILKFFENDLPLVISGVALAASVTIAVVNAILRYTISHPIPGADAIITLCFAYTVYVGSAAAFKKGAHYGVDVFVTKFSPKNQLIIKTVLDILIFVIMCLCFGLAFKLTMNAGNKRFEGLKASYVVYDFSAVLGFAYSILYAIEFVISDMKKLSGKEAQT